MREEKREEKGKGRREGKGGRGEGEEWRRGGG